VTIRAPALVLGALATGCVGGVSPVECATDADCTGGFCVAGECHAGTQTCPTLQPAFTSINHDLLQVGCGVKLTNCHSDGSSGVGSGPSFASDPYDALVNAPAANRLGSARGLILVKPGDPANSFLITKLRLTSPNDPLYGSGQPASAPGSICASTVDVIVQWIAQGAPKG
jgi:hypothetical protein